MSDILKAIAQITKYQPTVQRYVDYYDGRHKLTFASEKFKNTFGNTLSAMRDNLCPIVVEAVADRMEVINFSGANEADKVSSAAWELWTRNQMEIVSNNVHREAVKTGMGYLIVWKDEDSKARFYEQDARSCCLIEDEETGKPLFGAKMWLTEEELLRVTLYYPDRILKFITKAKLKNEGGSIDLTTKLKEVDFTGYESDTEQPENINEYGVIPLFKFETFPVLNDCVPIQDALNKTVCDKLVAMEFAAYPQRYATGLEPPVNEQTGRQELPFKAGVDRLWFADDKDTKFGQFASSDLTQYLKVADAYRLEMARVSGTPLHFFSINVSDAISGEALKTLESRFTKKVKRLCLNFGAVWSDAMQLALIIEGTAAEELSVQWDSPEQRSEKELLDALKIKKELGIPARVLFEELGYSVEDIANFGAAVTTPPAETNEVSE